MKFFLMLQFIFITAASANTQYRTPHVRTFNQGDSCLCSTYATLHALEVRKLQRDGDLVFLNRRDVQWSQVYDRFYEKISGYRTNANLGDCMAEATYPHDVIRQIIQYGLSAVKSEQIEHIPSFRLSAWLNYLIDNENGQDQKYSLLRSYLSKKIGLFSGQLEFTKDLLKDDVWTGYVPSENNFPVGTVPFVPPSIFASELPMPEKMPLVQSIPREKIFDKILASIKRGVPVPFCADYHCLSIDGVEVDENENIVKFLNANSYGSDDFIWVSGGKESAARNGFIYLILDN